MITLFGICFIAFAVIMILTKRDSAAYWVLAAGGAFPATVIAARGSNGVSPFYFVALFIAAASFTAFTTGKKRPPTTAAPGRKALLWFVGYALLITAVAPGIFGGTPVLSARGGVDTELQAPSELGYTVSNLAQATYLVLAVCIVFYFARSPRIPPHLPAIMFGLGTVFSTGRLVAGSAWPTSFFSNAPSIRYIDRTETGEVRERGIFGEPSALAGFSISSIVFFVALGMSLRGWKRAASLGLAGVALVNLVASATGTALVGGTLVAVVLLSFGVFRFLFCGAKLHPVILVLGTGGIVGLAILEPKITALFQGFLSDKTGSDSWFYRFESIRFSFGVMQDTWLLGAGLGSNRPTSFIPLLISCVGIPGTVLFVAAAFPLVRAAFKSIQYRPIAWVLIAFFSVKLLIGGSLDDEIMWLCLAICAHVAWRQAGAGPERVEAGGEPLRLQAANLGGRTV